ncbi:MAG TPA: PP2C family protein-serine/threonine phosphatase, partial [Thermoanaerobaculia bacterium]
AAFRERYQELAARAGLTLEEGEPRVYLSTGSRQTYGNLHPQDKEMTDWLLATRTAVRVEAFHSVRSTESWPAGNFAVDFSLDGRPYLITLWNRKGFFNIPDPETSTRIAERLIPLVLHPGESLSPLRRDLFGGGPRLMASIQGASPPQHVLAMASSALYVIRLPGTLDEVSAGDFETRMGRFFTTVYGGALGVLLVLVLFVILAFRSRVGVLNGALLALVALVTLNPLPNISYGIQSMSLLAVLGIGGWIFILWSCGESLLRSTDPEFTTSLDALRAGRLGPRGGRALLLGLSYGGATAGLRLGLLALAAALPGLWPEPPTLTLPLSSAAGSPVADGIEIAAGVALLLALSFRVLPRRWAPLAAAIVAGAVLSPLRIHPFAGQVAANAIFSGLLVYVARRHGLTALLATSVVSGLLPYAAFSAGHSGWMALGLPATVLPLAAFAVLGWIGLSRPAAAEVQRLSPPAFVRRLEEERRLRNEMDLPARMQRGLLPRTLPPLDGYEVAARSILANEAGGDLYDVLGDEAGLFWIAAGDVAGHGYSCAIALAMTKAALGSLIGRGRTPAEILRRMDLVLRAAGAKRNFTSLALLQLDPATGEATLSNAGHPYPLLAVDGEVRELPLPSLPLGQGPPRTYQDLHLRLTPGAALVFCSDGLFEAQDGDGSFYGFERAQRLLAVAASWDAKRILEALLADWSHHLRGAQSLDDTTVVVLRRKPRSTSE